MSRLALAALLLAGVAAQALAQAPRPPLLDGLYASNAVLQRDRPIVVRGQALPGEAVTLTLGTARTTARAGRDGAWHAMLPAMPAGGPHSLGVSAGGGGSARLENLLIGDVWLCSGQSNMELGVDRALDAPRVIANANDDRIRLLTVPKATAPTPLTRFAGSVRWQSVSPGSVADFSAACYFMARELRARSDVPIGLIDASWGGTAINAWRSEAGVRRTGDADQALAILSAYRRDRAEGNRLWGARWEDWWRARSGDVAGAEPWTEAGAARLAWRRVPSLTAWEGWGVPELASFNGMVWYAIDVALTPEQAAQAATLDLGMIDEIDQSWVNGTPVGNSHGAGSPRSYAVPDAVLRAGANRILVNVTDSYATGGMIGPPELRALRFADGSALPLVDGWTYSVAPGGSFPPRAPWEASAGIAGIYNAMIAPIADYGLAGVAWYQGESDAGEAAGYDRRLDAMRRDWRTQAGDDALPFLIVQLAGYGAAPTRPVESGFADVREAQRRAAAMDARSALVVAIDVGDRVDIHPANKLAIGERLARAARSFAGASAEASSGAWPASAAAGEGSVEVTFDRVTGVLDSHSGAPIGFELCGAERGTCRFVAAEIVGDVIRVGTPAATDTRVRYCWGDSPVCNVTDASGLPVTPFELMIER